MNVLRELEINAAPKQVWGILAHNFHKADQWASSIYVSSPRSTGTTHPETPFVESGRTCETELGGFKETIVHYDEKNMRFGYQAQGEKMPFFVKGLSNTWTVKPTGNGYSHVTSKVEIKLMPVIGTIMGPMMKMQLGGVIKSAMEELKHFVETGKPHPRKVQAAQKGKK